jgi:hypothetical protein
MSLNRTGVLAVRTSLFILAMISLAAPSGWAASPADPAIAFFAGSNNANQLVVVNADGTKQTVVWSDPTVSPSWPHWSPDLDGNPSNGYQGTLAFAPFVINGDDRIMLLEVTVSQGVPRGINPRVVVDSAIDPLAAGGLTRPFWSPDLDPLTAGYQGKLCYIGLNLDGSTTNIDSLDVAWNGDSGAPATVAVHGPNTSTVLYDGTVLHQDISSASWSPDGSHIAFASRTSTTSPDVLMTLEVATGNISGPFYTSTRYILASEWSRTSSRIAISDGQTNLVVVDVSQPNPTPVPIPVFDYEVRSVTWSPDDRYMVASGRDHRGTKLLYLRQIELATGIKSVLANLKGMDCLHANWRAAP